ncbi:MAG: mechanosensitive ion channel [Halorubrum sp.]
MFGAPVPAGTVATVEGVIAAVIGQTPSEFLDAVPDRVWFALVVLVVGTLVALLVGAGSRRLLTRAGIPGAIEGTAFERTAREFGTSTVRIVAKLATYFVVAVTVVVAFSVAEVEFTERFWADLAAFIPRLFVAAIVLLVGVVVGDKAELLVAERFREVKLPEVGVIPALVKYSVVYVAALIALAQVGVQTLALVVLLGAYALAVVVLTALATKDLLAAAAAGVFLLLRQPYGIGDEVRVAGQRGIVQEVDLFVTHIETDDGEHVLPNHRVFRDGIVLIRE